MEFKGTKEDWELTFTSDRKRAIRSKSGLICVLPSPSKYPGQDKRYDDELEEVKANQKLIASAPEMLEILEKTFKELDQCKDAIFELMEHQDGWEANLERVESLIERTELLIKEVTE